MELEFANIGLFSYDFVQGLGVRLFLFLVIFIVSLFFLILHAVFVFRLINIETNFTHAVVIADLFNGGLDDDVIFVDGHVFHIVEQNAEHLLIVHTQELKLL
jgi:hypothetical protein